MLDFLIEKSRTRGSFAGLAISTAIMADYGWALHQHAHPAVVLVLQFMQGVWGTFFYTTYSAMLVDSFLQSPSTAAATTSVARWAMAATSVAIFATIARRGGARLVFHSTGAVERCLLCSCHPFAALERYGMEEVGNRCRFQVEEK